MKRAITFILLCLSLSVTMMGQVRIRKTEPVKQAPVKQAPVKQAPVTVPASKPVIPTSSSQAEPITEKKLFGYLLVNTDIDIKITVNFGQQYVIRVAESGRRIQLDLGVNTIKVVPLDGGNDGYTETLNLDDPTNLIFNVEIGKKRAFELQKIEEEKRQKEKEKKEKEVRDSLEKIEQIKKVEALFPENAKGIASSMVRLKGGTFLMGCSNNQNNDCYDDEDSHRVNISDFWINRYEVSVWDFHFFRILSGYITDAEKGGGSYVRSGDELVKKSGIFWIHDVNGNKVEDPMVPVTHLSWNDATAYCKWLSQRTGEKYRLPTEAEWEFAARGGLLNQGNKYSGSNNIDEVGWYKDNSDGRIQPSGKKKPNELGLFDMCGNVAEWCQDYYDYYDASQQNNPQGPNEGDTRVIRGGSWQQGAQECRNSSRYDDSPSIRYYFTGFRLAR